MVTFSSCICAYLLRQKSFWCSFNIYVFGKRIVMFILQGCLIRLMSNMNTHCGCVVFSPPTAVSFCQYTEEERASQLLQSGTASGFFNTVWNIVPFCFLSQVFQFRKQTYLHKTMLSKTCFFFAVSKYLTLLIEIHPINNVRVLKAVDSCVRVQVKYSTNLKISPFNLLC